MPSSTEDVSNEAHLRSVTTALEQIADGMTPCLDCGQVHRLLGYIPPKKSNNWRGVPGSWAHPDDGHAYRKMRADVLARKALGRDE